MRSVPGGEAATHEVAGTSERRRKPAKSSGGAFRAKEGHESYTRMAERTVPGIARIVAVTHAPAMRHGSRSDPRGKSLQWSDLSDEMTAPWCHKPKTPAGRRGFAADPA